MHNNKAIDELSEILKNIINSGKLIFRGVSNVDEYKLIPKIGRDKYTKDKERTILDSFKSQAIPLLKSIPNTQLDWLSLAQHYGLSTRLLDWTDNTLVALYFAAKGDDKKDGAIHALEIAAYEEYEHRKFLTANDKDLFTQLPEPFFILRPNIIDNRILIQQSLFTLSGNPRREIKTKYIFKISSNLKPNILFLLDKIGINEKSLFPGLDSLSQYLNVNYKKFM